MLTKAPIHKAAKNGITSSITIIHDVCVFSEI